MTLTERAVLRLLALQPLTTGDLSVALGFATVQSNKALRIALERLRGAGAIERHQAYGRNGVHRWEMVVAVCVEQPSTTHQE